VNIAAVMILRIEADVPSTKLEYRRSIGVSDFWIIGNGPTNGTSDVLGVMAETYSWIYWTSEPGLSHQSEFVPNLAQLAHRSGADRIVPIDADEFWWIRNRSLVHTLDVFCARQRGRGHDARQLVKSEDAWAANAHHGDKPIVDRKTRTLGRDERLRAAVSSHIPLSGSRRGLLRSVAPWRGSTSLRLTRLSTVSSRSSSTRETTHDRNPNGIHRCVRVDRRSRHLLTRSTAKAAASMVLPIYNEIDHLGEELHRIRPRCMPGPEVSVRRSDRWPSNAEAILSAKHGSAVLFVDATTIDIAT